MMADRGDLHRLLEGITALGAVCSIKVAEEKELGLFSVKQTSAQNAYNQARLVQEVERNREAIWADYACERLLILPEWGDPGDRSLAVLRGILELGAALPAMTIAILVPDDAFPKEQRELQAIGGSTTIDLFGILRPQSFLEWFALLSGASVIIETSPPQPFSFLAEEFGFLPLGPN